MCGIMGYIGDQDASRILVDGLRKLEYRGYDSAGVATLNGSGSIDMRRTVGKLTNLEDALSESRLPDTSGSAIRAGRPTGLPARRMPTLTVRARLWSSTTESSRIFWI